MTGTAPLDQVVVEINGVDYTLNISEAFDVTKTPDTMSRTCSMSAYELDQLLEQGADVHVGARVRIKANREGLPATADEEVLMVGILVDKVVMEDGVDYDTGKPGDDRSAQVDLVVVDDLYKLGRTYGAVIANAQTFSKDLFAFFKDDGSGSGAPTQYVRKAELREFNGSYFIPWEDMDTIPPHSFRRKKDDEPSVYITFNEYVMQYQKKELVFQAAQVNPDDPTEALPNQYVSGTPNPPASTNDDWQYKMTASFFKNPDYPQRNTSSMTAENLLRTVFAGDPLSEVGGAGFTTAQLNIDFAYDKGAAETIPDRLDEGMRVSAVSGADVTVSDGDAWAGKTSLSYFDAQGIPRTATISSILGDVLTLSAAPTNLVAGGRVYGCDQLGIIVELTDAGATTYDMANYTDVTIEGRKYFIREIRDSVTLVIVNENETGDFSALDASGTLTYHTLEYTGLQVNRYNWRKDRDTLAELIGDMHEKLILPINYRIDHIPATRGIPIDRDIIRGRLDRQYMAEVQGAPAGLVVTVDDVDGFYPGHTIAWYDATNTRWRMSTVTSVDYSAEALTLAAVTGIADGTVLYADGRLIYRQTEVEHALSLDNMFYRTELISTANQSFPVLDSSSDSDLTAPPASPPVGGWSVIEGDAAAMVDDTPTTMYLLRWVHTGAGQLEGDPEQYDMTPIPWPVVAYDSGELAEYDQVLLQIGYIDDRRPTIDATGYREMPMFSVECSSQDVALASVTEWTACCSELIAKVFDPTNPNTGQLNFKCDLVKRFRHIRILVDRPFFFKVKENTFGTPTRARDVPILTFQLYKRPLIKYQLQDETQSTDNLSPNKQIEPHVGETPFAQLTNKGGDISLISTLTLTVGSGHGFEDTDTIEFWDTSAGVPFAGASSSASVVSHTATTITVSAIPAGLTAGDKVGAARRWMLDISGTWRDMLAKLTIAQMFEHVKPLQQVEDESPQNGWDAQQLAVTRQYESMLNVRDGKASCLFDPKVSLYDQVVSSGLMRPEKVVGIIFSGFNQALQFRQYNRLVEQIAGGDE